MATILAGMKNSKWDLYKSEYDETDNLYLMASPGPVCIILAVYLMFVLKIGPSMMRKKEPYKLTSVLILYNAFQVVISAYLFQRYTSRLWNSGLVPRKCQMADDVARKELLVDIWLYFAAKVTELLDTVFFVFRKKDSQITFLHLYHHSIMMIGTWTFLKFWPSYTLVFIGCFNSLVHVFMYTYYLLSALGPKVSRFLFWKKYMTKLQLIQFVSIIIQYVISVRTTECPPSKGVAVFVSCNTAFFLFLFAKFYIKSYNKRRSNKTSNGVTIPITYCSDIVEDKCKEI